MNVLDRFLKQCKIQEGRTLIVGSKIHDGTNKRDRRKRYKDALGVDMEDGNGVDFVRNLEDEWPDLSYQIGQFVHVECTSVLEHSRRPWLLCANLEKIMEDGATIIVMVPWVWREHNYPGDFYRYTKSAIASLLPSITWELDSYIVEGRLVDEVPTLTHMKTRWYARSELVMFGRKCNSIS